MTPMSQRAHVDVWYSLQSDYCYFLLDRLVALSARGVDVAIRPVLGLVLRMPEATRDRGPLEQAYFLADSRRTAEFLGLAYAPPEPSPIAFEPGTVWIAAAEQPRIERLYRLFVGAERAGRGLAFLDVVGRGLWNGANPGWDAGDFLSRAMTAISLDHDRLLGDNPWTSVRQALHANHLAMLEGGHWGVPLMSCRGELFHGQDRFDQLLWRLGLG